MSLFSGIETAYSAMSAQQLFLETSAHNIANASTPGYHRQDVSTVASTPLQEGSGIWVGTGVQVLSVGRPVDSFVETSLYQQLGQQGSLDIQQQTTSQIGSIFNDLGTNSTGSLLDQFWSSWSDVANAPTDMGARQSLIGSAQNLASSIQSNYQQLQSMQQNLDTQVSQSVSPLNGLTSQIASLNQQITQAQADGGSANDLLDQRANALTQLSTLAGVTSFNKPNGTVQVVLGSTLLVDGNTSTTLSTQENASGMQDLVAPDGTVIKPTSGTIGGLESLRDGEIPTRMTALNDFAQRLITAVNGVQTGVDPTTGAVTNVYNLVTPGTPAQQNFFAGTGAADIAVDPSIVSDPRLIAASQTANGSGDGSNAQAMAALKTDTSAGGVANGLTLDGQYQALATAIGMSASNAQAADTNQQSVVASLQQQRDQLSGVSLDQEAANTVLYQQAYNAAARVLATFDQVLDQLINHTGLPGG